VTIFRHPAARGSPETTFGTPGCLPARSRHLGVTPIFAKEFENVRVPWHHLRGLMGEERLDEGLRHIKT